MERNSWNTLNAGGVDGKSISSRKGQAQEPWEYRNPFHGDDLYSGFSWPPRSYTCSFCKREFRSAQALGGHMNVHRRDRARLRQSPPWESHPQTTDLHPNPNQSFSTFSPSTKLYKLSSMHDPSIPTAVNVLRDNSPVLGSTSSKDDLPKTMNTFKGFMQEEECSIKKGKKLVLDLEIGVGSNVCEDLDLELRLGYS